MKGKTIPVCEKARNPLPELRFFCVRDWKKTIPVLE
jgi:hypothetical protein